MMKSFEEMEEAKLARWNTPAVLGVSSTQITAFCPECSAVLCEQFPPIDKQLNYSSGKSVETHPHCYSCGKLLLIQCHDINAEHRLNELNQAQRSRIDKELSKLGAKLNILQSGRYQLLFAGKRTNYSPDFKVLAIYEHVTKALIDSFGFSNLALKEVHRA